MYLYKFAKPMDSHEAEEIYTMIEDRGDRALFELVDNTGRYELLPTYVFSKSEMVVIE